MWTELRERVLFFNGRKKKSAEDLDYASGETLKGKALAEAFPALDKDLDALFGAGHVSAETSVEEKDLPRRPGDPHHGLPPDPARAAEGRPRRRARRRRARRGPRRRRLAHGSHALLIERLREPPERGRDHARPFLR